MIQVSWKSSNFSGGIHAGKARMQNRVSEGSCFSNILKYRTKFHGLNRRERVLSEHWLDLIFLLEII